MSSTPWPWLGSTVTKVIDGDSLIARLSRDLGFHGTAVFEQRLRLNRINTPPLKTTQGAAAATYVQDHTTGVVDITTIKPYKYGDEWMAEVVLPDGSNLSDALVAAGLAVYWDGTGPRPGG